MIKSLFLRLLEQ